MSPARRRAAVTYLQRRFRVSQRRACKVVGQGRSTQRYAIVPSDFEARLVTEMRALAETHPRWGYRKIHRLLGDGGWAVNAKRIERLWRAEGLRVSPRRADRPNGKYTRMAVGFHVARSIGARAVVTALERAEGNRRGDEQRVDAASPVTEPCVVL